MDILSALNEAQREAVTLDIDQNGAIVAGAGTGKTRVLTHRIAHLLQHHNVHPASILAVTFTNKAAKEMRSRIASIVGEQEAKALRMGTFHGIGVSFLRRYGKHVGLPKPEVLRPLDLDDGTALLRRIMKEELSKEELEFLKPSDAYQIIIAWKESGHVPSTVPNPHTPEEQLALQLFAPYEAEKSRSNAIDFPDMILMPVRILLAKPEIAHRMHEGLTQMLVDEFQDTNPLQMRLIDLLTNTGTSVAAFVVGDDDQSIYSWRGAKAGIFKQFLERYPNPKLVRLEQNYRCNSLILEAANSVIANNVNRIPKTLFTENQQADFLTLRAFRDAEAEAESVAADIADKIKNGESPTEIAVLYRKNSVSRLLEHALLRHRVPYRIHGGHAFYTRKEIKDALSYLHLVHDPMDEIAFARAVSVPPRSVGEKTLKQIFSAAKESGVSPLAIAAQAKPGKLRDFADLLCKLHAVYQSQGLGFLVAAVIQHSGIAEYYVDREKEKGEERCENLQELLGAATIFHHQYHMGESTDGSLSRKPGDPLSVFLTEAALDADGATRSNQQPSVDLMTIHKAKGLEYNRVYILALEEGEFPTERSTKDLGVLEEERRLFYVALTRARHFLHLSHARFRMRFSSGPASGYGDPSRFLEEIPDHLLEHQLVDLDAKNRLSAPSRKALPGKRAALPSSAAVDLW